MINELSKIRFMAANYSRLQGLREVPVGLLVASVSIWAIYNHGPNADLTLLITLTLVAALLYWLVDRYYIRVFGRIRQTAKMRIWETTASVLFSLLALLAFWLDTAIDLPFSVLGLVFALALFEDFWRATSFIRERSFALYPENLLAAIILLVLSLLPLTGLSWWEIIGIQSQVIGMLVVIGVLITVAGIWGHVRIIRTLPVGEAKSNDNSL